VVPVAVPLAPRLVDQVTWLTPMLSDAAPPRLRTLYAVVNVDPSVLVSTERVCVRVPHADTGGSLSVTLPTL